MIRTDPSTPIADASVITISTTSKFAAKGDEELPTGVPAKNQGALVAIDAHQTAAAAVMTGMHTATKTASTPTAFS
jgi:hypothetical protein